MTPIDKLPPKLLSHILLFIHAQGARRTLLAAALVSRQWRDVAQRVLFGELSLRSGSQLIAWLASRRRAFFPIRTLEIALARIFRELDSPDFQREAAVVSSWRAVEASSGSNLGWWNLEPVTSTGASSIPRALQACEHSQSSDHRLTSPNPMFIPASLGAGSLPTLLITLTSPFNVYGGIISILKALPPTGTLIRLGLVIDEAVASPTLLPVLLTSFNLPQLENLNSVHLHERYFPPPMAPSFFSSGSRFDPGRDFLRACEERGLS